MENRTVASVNEVIRSAVDLARICLRMDVAFITEFKDGLRVFRHVATADEYVPIKVGDADPLYESYCQYVVDGQIPGMVDDSHIAPILKMLPVTEALQIRAHLGVPIRLSDGSVFGTFCCYSREPITRLGTTEVEAMGRFAALIGTLLEERIVEERCIAAVSTQLSNAISTNALRMAFQPIVNLRTGRVVGLEALARFQALPERGPDQWFEDAHRVSRGEELEVIALQQALAEIDKLPAAVYLSVNVSPRTILSGKLGACFKAAPVKRVVLEVTEHVPVEDYALLGVALSPLRAAGLRLAIDDAGSGFASFRHILRLHPDMIKLDQSLIHTIERDPGRRALASAIANFAFETGSSVVAEGVETQDEVSVLASLGVQAAQGYLFGRPEFLT